MTRATIELGAPELTLVRERRVRLYLSVTVLMLVGIAVLLPYAVWLSLQPGRLTGPGVESSFGYAVALLFLMGAVLVHLVDQTYRVWPAGRRMTPALPVRLTDRSVANFLKIVVIVGTALAIAYVVAGLIS